MYVHTYVCIHVYTYLKVHNYVAAADTSSGQSQQAANFMPQYMQALNQMGAGWLSALSNATGNSGLFYVFIFVI